MTTKGIFVSIVMIVTLSMLFAAPLAAAEGATIWTDKADYAPEETVHISGSGFLPNSALTIEITRPDGEVDSLNDVVSDESGGFTTAYLLDGITGTYTVTATDRTNTATTTFTDGPPVQVTTSTTLINITSPLVAGQTGVPYSGKISATPDVPDDQYVKLENSTDNVTFDPIATTTTTGGNGTFSGTFTAPTSGTYYFRAHFIATGVKDGYNWHGSFSDVQEITVNPAFQSFKVSGYKYDTEGNPLNNWTITLSKDDTPSASAVTGAGDWPDGYYEFTVTAPGEYTINETLKAAWTATSPGYQVGDPINTTEVQGYNFTASSGDADITGMNFTNFEWLTVSGIKEDTGGNGLPGWTIKLYNDSAEYASTMTVETTGAYSFTAKDPGNYSIAEVLQAGWTAISPSYQVGDPVNTAEVEGYNFTAVSGTDVPDQNFINFEWLTVSGYKFFDANGDGDRDAGESGLQYWVIKLDENGTQYLPNVTTDSTGYYAFTVKDLGTYTVSEIQKPPMWLCTTPTGGAYTFTAQSGTNVTADFGNWLGSSSFVTTSGLCYFDVDGNESNGRQFKLIFTPDVPEYPSKYRLTASNPGQFYYNIFYVGDLAAGSFFEITLPYPFITQGEKPVHVYSSLNTGPGGCLIPGTDITSQFTISPLKTTFGETYNAFGNTSIINVTSNGNYSGFIYINIHLDYGLKKNIGGLNKDAFNNAAPIINNQTYTFSARGVISEDSDTVKNVNMFKRDPGFAGLVTDTAGNPCENVTVEIYGPDAPLATVHTDKDGWYFCNYKHTGKVATFTIKLPDYNLDQAALLKANKIVVVDFQIIP